MNFQNTFKDERTQDSGCNGVKTIVTDSTAQNGTLDTLITYKDEKIQDSSNNGVSIDKPMKKSSSTKNGQCYPIIATKKKWLSTILNNTDHEELIKEGIEKKTGFVPNLPSLYRRNLDDEHCVSLNTEFGRHLLASTLYKGNYANIYYTLSQQFHTQCDSMQCGPSSFVYALNALGVDPGRQWRYPWRWYDEEVLIRCTPVEYTRSVGCSFDMMICIAKNNGVCVDVVRASQEWTEEDFRNDVKRSCASFDQVLLMSFSRKTLKQIGTGHFSPIGAYNEEHDMVLVMEIARFKYPPFWTKLSKMWEALQSIAVNGDMKVTSGMPRGYFMVRKAKSGESTSPRLRLPWQQAVFQMKLISNDDKVIHTMYVMKKSKKVWTEWLNQKTEERSTKENEILVKAVNKIIEISKELDPPIHRNMETPSRQMLSKFNFPDVQKTSSFQVIKQRLQYIPTDDIDHLKDIAVELLSLVEIPGQVVSTESQADMHVNGNGFTESNGYLADNHVLDFQEELNKIAEILTSMILFWPYAIEEPNAETTTNIFRIQTAIEPDMIHFPYSRTRSIPEQLNTILKSIDHAGHEVIYGEKKLDV